MLAHYPQYNVFTQVWIIKFIKFMELSLIQSFTQISTTYTF